MFGRSRCTKLPRRRRTPRTPVESLEGRRLLSSVLDGGVWDISGDAERRAPNDAIAVSPVDAEPGLLRVTINGTEVGQAAIGATQQIRINAGRGNDVVTIDLGTSGQSIAVTVIGGHGDDRISGAGEADTFVGGPGNDRLDGGGGNDSLAGDAGDDELIGGDGDDALRGGARQDVLAGGWGNDTLLGEKGHDLVRGGAGDDRLEGGPGNDRLVGGDGADAMSGGRGADQNVQQDGVDTLVPPAGAPANAPAVDKRDTVAADNVTTPATRQEDDAQLKQWLIDAAVKQWQWAFGQPANPWGYYYGVDGEVLVGRGEPPPTTGAPVPAPSPTPAPAPPGVPGAGGAISTPGTDGVGATPDTGTGSEADGGTGTPGRDDHSDTNTQETGVDEADLVETDGQYLYTLNDSSLVIVNAVPASGMSVVSRTAFEASPVGIYLHGERLTVISAEFSWRLEPMPIGRVVGGEGGGAAVDVIAPPGEPPKAEVHVTVFDVSDPAAPSQVEKTSFDGTYGGSRLVGERLYLVVSNDTWVPPPEIIPGPGDGATDPPPTDPPPPVDGPPVIGDDVAAQLTLAPDWRPGGDPGGIYESEASYRARLEALPLADLVPGYRATSSDGASTSGMLVTSGNAYVRDLGDPNVGQNLTTVTLLNLGDTAGGPTATSTVAGFGGEIYSSADSLYLAGATWDNALGESTRLMKFQLAPDAVPLVATGEVQGAVLDQFAMDEEGDHFRIATTGFSFDVGNGGAPTGELTNNLFVLDQSGDELNVIGSLTHLKDGEQLRSARFVGDRAYLVTFRQVDPLFSISLADPTHPVVTGELVIPGFSSYLQPVGEDLLLGIGRDVDPDTNADRGVQLSLFDVSDPADPRRVDAIGLSDRWETSEAEFDHHAFAYFSDQQILAVPVTQQSGDALMVIKIDASQGSNALQLLGEPTIEGGVRRSVRITDVLYAVGPDRVQAMPLTAPETVVGEVDLKP